MVESSRIRVRPPVEHEQVPYTWLAIPVRLPRYTAELPTIIIFEIWRATRLIVTGKTSHLYNADIHGWLCSEEQCTPSLLSERVASKEDDGCVYLATFRCSKQIINIEPKLVLELISA